MVLVEVRQRLDEERRHLMREGERIEVLPQVTRLRIGSSHVIACSLLSAATADQVIIGEIDHHHRLGVPFEWKLYAHDTPADLLQRLQRHGLEVGPREAVLVYDLAAVPEWAGDDAPCTVVRVDRPEQIAEYRRIAERIFEKDYERTATELSEALTAGSTGHRGYIAYVDDEAVSIGRLYTDPRSHFAGLYGGGTRPDYRGRGCYRALVAARARDAMQLGARYLQVDALPTSRPILERLGFAWLTDTWPCEWKPRADLPA
jgi:GNAT superfamily N-acetyltransferase